MESGTIVKWLKAEGDTVEKGEPLYELDTDKVTQEVEAEAAACCSRSPSREGEVPVGHDGRRSSASRGRGRAASVGGGAAPTEPEPAERAGCGSRVASRAARPRAPRPRNGGRIKASPLARRIARERGIDLAALAGTGPEGRIVAEDVERAGRRRAGAGSGRARPRRPERSSASPLTSLRKTIARRMTEAWQAPASRSRCRPT